MSFLRNKTLIVSGASSGIGRALSLALAQRGVSLVLNARSAGPESQLEQTCHECGQHGVRAVCVAGSVGEEGVVRDMVQEAVKIGNFGGFIHAAGVLHPGPTLWELEPWRFDEVFEAGVRGAYLLVRHTVPLLLESGGGLAVFFGSGAAQITQPGIAAYCAAKAAEEHLMRQLAAEAPSICTFVFRPGIVDTPMQTQARQSTGGAAEELKKVFVPWKEQGELISPQQAARGLVRALEGDPWIYHSGVAHVDDLLRA